MPAYQFQSYWYYVQVLKIWPPVGHRVGHRVGHGLPHVLSTPAARKVQWRPFDQQVQITGHRSLFWVVSILVKQWPVTCVLYLPPIDAEFVDFASQVPTQRRGRPAFETRKNSYLLLSTCYEGFNISTIALLFRVSSRTAERRMKKYVWPLCSR